eukprot:11650999-Alexandrium_andersonii.AAC.1
MSQLPSPLPPVRKARLNLPYGPTLLVVVGEVHPPHETPVMVHIPLKLRGREAFHAQAEGLEVAPPAPRL